MSNDRPSRPDGSLDRRSEAGRFFVSGGAATLLFFVSLLALTGWGVAPFAASVVAYFVCIGVSFGLQQNWTFRTRSPARVTFPRYLALQAGCATTSGIVAELGRFWGLDTLVLASATTLAMAGVSYLVSRNLVFRTA
jgi:putative flippase GtrA